MMRISVRLVPRSSKSEIIKLSEKDYKVYLHEAPVDNKANKKLIAMLAEYFDMKKSGIRIVGGARSKNKTVELGS